MNVQCAIDSTKCALRRIWEDQYVFRFLKLPQLGLSTTFRERESGLFLECFKPRVAVLKE